MDERKRQILLNEACKSEMEHRHSAIVVWKEKYILSKGYNKKYDGFKMNDMYSIHAEVHALSKLNIPKFGKIIDECTMYVIRIGGSKNDGYLFKNSKPCPHCETYIKKFGIKKVFYSSQPFSI